ncbi:GerAB/ArcD/ProY family transporter [Paenibacillus sp. LPE1-1-1.1]|uniref:GerAB/ArcD/ProY family transporter n=1 Tax=Paenibacillus sp. LPE1-1-1.1 TaxID=3135230 RepID=UPI00341B9289
MLKKGKISAFQMAIMLYPTVLLTGFLVLPTITAQYAANDLWLTGILASLMGFLTVYVMTRMHEIYPKQTFIEYSEHIIGKTLGKIMGIVYFLYLLYISGIVSRQYAEFVIGSFLFKTPILLIISSLVFLSAAAVRGGIEVLARSSAIFTPIFILPLFFLLLLFPELDVKNILPILSHGMIPVIISHLRILSLELPTFFTLIPLLLLLAAVIRRRKSADKGVQPCEKRFKIMYFTYIIRIS